MLHVCVFSLCRKLVGHFPLGGWLWVAIAFIKRRAAPVTTGWDGELGDVLIATMISEVIARGFQKNPVHSKWCVDGYKLDVRGNASSLMAGVSLKNNCIIIEDASWFEKGEDCAAHKSDRIRRRIGRCKYGTDVGSDGLCLRIPTDQGHSVRKDHDTSQNG